MRCSKAKRYFDLANDQELNTKHRTALNVHIANCSRCQKWQTEASRLHTMLSETKQIEFPAWVHAQIMDKVHRLDNVRPSFIRRYKLGPATAALAVIISFWAGAQVGKTSYNNSITEVSETSTSFATADASDFGENSLLDSYYLNGGSNE